MSRPRTAPDASEVRTTTTEGPRAFDFLVIGSGLAGLHYALRVAELGDVAVITKRHASDSATDGSTAGSGGPPNPRSRLSRSWTTTSSVPPGATRSAA